MGDSDLLARETARRYSGPEALLTYKDYRKTPPGQRYELVEGVLRRVNAPSIPHQVISQRLEQLLLGQLQGPGKGRVLQAPVDVVFSEHDVVQPDLLFITSDRLGIITDANVQGAPDLVVEILSRSTEQWDGQTKRGLYARYGVREYWLVDPESQTVEVTSLGGSELVTAGVYGAGTAVESPLLPGIQVEVGALFCELQTAGSGGVGQPLSG
jgi:Uma2 family endonuclease